MVKKSQTSAACVIPPPATVNHSATEFSPLSALLWEYGVGCGMWGTKVRAVNISMNLFVFVFFFTQELYWLTFFHSPLFSRSFSFSLLPSLSFSHHVALSSALLLWDFFHLFLVPFGHSHYCCQSSCSRRVFVCLHCTSKAFLSYIPVMAELEMQSV